MSEVDKNDYRFCVADKKFRVAFLKMLDENPNEKITVKSLCDRAGYSRSAFYAHFTDIEELYDNLKEIGVSRVAQAIGSLDDYIKLSNNKFFDKYIDNIVGTVSEFCVPIKAAIKSDHGEQFIEGITKLTEEEFLDAYRRNVGEEPDNKFKLYARYTASSLYGFIVEWQLYTSMTNEEATAILHDLYLHLIATTFDYLREKKEQKLG